jgi:hypothetical protein
MLTLEEILERLKDRNLTMVARESGVPYATLWAWNRKPPENPTYANVKALSHYFMQKAA